MEQPTAELTDSCLSVSAFNQKLRDLVEQQLPPLWVGGEVSNLSRASSGHAYFMLKDANAQVRCVMFRRHWQLLTWQVENGQQVRVYAAPAVYPARGEFQLIVEQVQRAGAGAWYEAYLRLRDKLEREGLFATARKRPIPKLPQRIGIITSLEAAALQDVRQALRRRAPHVELLLYPSLVQGALAATQLCAALRLANLQSCCEVLLLVRGGGSIEDLWAFNDEQLARTLAGSTLPVVSGIGHASDQVIADLVVDLCAPTPTAAAEMVSHGWVAAAQELEQLRLRLAKAAQQGLQRHMQALDLLERRLRHPAQTLATWRGKLQLLGVTLHSLAQRALQRHAGQVAQLATSLEALNPAAVLQRGYCLVFDADAKLCSDGKELRQDQRIRLRFAQGECQALVTRPISD